MDKDVNKNAVTNVESSNDFSAVLIQFIEKKASMADLKAAAYTEDQKKLIKNLQE